MKRIISLVLALALAMCVTLVLAEEAAPEEEESIEVELMTHEEYAQAEIDAPVYVETYVQATQSWWQDKITVYAQSEDGAYFIYELACSEEDAAKLVPGTKIAVVGFKSEWSGEIEITGDNENGIPASFEFVDGDLMGANERIAFPRDTMVLPNQTIDISVYMTAPEKSGKYQGNWKIRTPWGSQFGTGDNGENSVWVKIYVR